MWRINVLFVVIAWISKVCDGCPMVCDCVSNSVNCSNRGLDEIPENIPSSSTELFFRNNSITELNLGEIEFHTLHTLDLRDNLLETIPSRVFRMTSFLRTLNLDNNRLDTISRSETFFGEGENSLTHVTLSRNLFTGTIYQRFLFHMIEVKFLDISHNGFTLIPANAFPLQLEHLDLSYNRFNQFNRLAFANLKDLTYLDLRGLDVEVIGSDLFTDMRSLKRLRIGGRNVNSIEANLLSGLHSLTTLEIVDSDVTSLPSELLIFSQSLRHLDLSNNRLDSLQQEFFNHVLLLRSLNLTGNNLYTLGLIADSLLNLNLEELILDSMSLAGSVSSLVRRQNELQRLSLARNNLSAFNYEIVSSTLRNLNLAYNNLTKISTNAFVDCTALQSLNLTGNQFSSFPVLRTSSSLNVFIANNLWNCSCEFHLEFLSLNGFDSATSNLNFSCQSDMSSADNLDCLICQFPERYAGMYVGDLQDELSFCNVVEDVITSSSSLASNQQPEAATNIPNQASSSLIEIVVPIVVIVVIAFVVALFFCAKRSQANKQLEMSAMNHIMGSETAESHDVGVYETIPYATDNSVSCHEERRPASQKENDYNNSSLKYVQKSYGDNGASFHSDAFYSNAQEQNQTSSLEQPSIVDLPPENHYLPPLRMQSTSFVSEEDTINYNLDLSIKKNNKGDDESRDEHQNYYVSMK